jgi:hypothetical protein
MLNKGVHSQGSLLANVLIGHTVDFATHTSTICIKYQVLLAAYYKAVKSNTHLFFPFLDTYYITFCAISLFFIHSVFFRLMRLPGLPSGQTGRV